VRLTEGKRDVYGGSHQLLLCSADVQLEIVGLTMIAQSIFSLISTERWSMLLATMIADTQLKPSKRDKRKRLTDPDTPCVESHVVHQMHAYPANMKDTHI
jgi:hypothetical protein